MGDPATKGKQITVRDIARHLNISVSTVSRALHDHKNIKPEVKKRILDLALELNYQPNLPAQSLRTHRTNTLGVIVSEIVMHFFSSTISGIQEYAAQRNYNIMVCQSMESSATEALNVQKLLSNRVDGLMISLSSNTENVKHLEELIQKKIPIILFDRVWDDLDVSKVVVDDRKASYEAVDYLAKTGCKRIAYLGGSRSLYISKERQIGYRQALIDNGLPLNEEHIIHCQDLHVDPTVATHRLLDHSETPDALFCMNDPIAIQAMQVLKERKIKIPDQISVIGFTNEPISNYIEPSLTTVSQPSEEMGRIAASLFIQQLEKPESFKPVKKVIETKFIIRNSTRQLH